MKQPRSELANRLATLEPGACCTSIVVSCELRYGANKKGSTRLIDRIDALLACLEILPLDAGVDR
ncbi:MAG: hypothetical protein R3202_06720, partial [Candidatus Competibacterales bacterium]|nr:hypothetical protein [Candidatus Competibacterales bacterium]